MSLFFTADTHFGHTNLTRAGRTPEKARPFDTVEEHDDYLVRQWNAVVRPHDTVYHLGDVCWGRGGVEKFKILERLNGNIHLIRGNHDRDIKGHGNLHRCRWILGQDVVNRPGDRFETIQDLFTLKHNGRKIVLCHYPLTEWDSSFHGSIHLHGHCHHNLPQDPDRLRQDIGVDGWDWTPVSVEAVFTLMDEKAKTINARTIERSRLEAAQQAEQALLNPVSQL